MGNLRTRISTFVARKALERRLRKHRQKRSRRHTIDGGYSLCGK